MRLASAGSFATMRALDADNACGHGGNPPPRTISDIAAILDAERPDPKKIEQLRAAAGIVRILL
jgi:hypothetical protein